MTLLASALIGTWQLERWEIVYDDGRPAECPLGEDAVGYLIYTGDGHVSASLARAGRAPIDAGADGGGDVAQRQPRRRASHALGARLLGRIAEVASHRLAARAPIAAYQLPARAAE